LEEFDFNHARGLKRDIIAHLGTLDIVTAKDNVVFLGPPARRAAQPLGCRLRAQIRLWCVRVSTLIASADTSGIRDEMGRQPSTLPL
jgi:hypothetical protein